MVNKQEILEKLTGIKSSRKNYYTELTYLVTLQQVLPEHFATSVPLRNLFHQTFGFLTLLRRDALLPCGEESELFGYEKGAFTGAVKTRKGFFELANNGTLFLDGIGEAPASIQIKLLRTLETGEYMRVGGEHVAKSSIRFISATNRDLEHEVEVNRFRRDLLYRLEGIKLSIPPLRERIHDIPVIAHTYLKKRAKPRATLTRRQWRSCSDTIGRATSGS